MYSYIICFHLTASSCKWRWVWMWRQQTCEAKTVHTVCVLVVWDWSSISFFNLHLQSHTDVIADEFLFSFHIYACTVLQRWAVINFSTCWRYSFSLLLCGVMNMASGFSISSVACTWPLLLNLLLHFINTRCYSWPVSTKDFCCVSICNAFRYLVVPHNTLACVY